MKNLILLLTFFLTIPLMAQEETNNPNLYSTIVIQPKHGHYPQAFDAIKSHNTKFHAEGMARARVWSIDSGPRSGSLIWAMGAHDWAHFDKPEMEGHTEDWMGNTDPHFASSGDYSYWRFNRELSYIPEGFTPKVRFVRYFNIKPDKANNANHLWAGLKKAYQESNYDVAVVVLNKVTDSGDNVDWAIYWVHGDWASMDKNRNFAQTYDKLNGNNAWEEFLENWREATDLVRSEIHSLVSELSAPPRE